MTIVTISRGTYTGGRKLAELLSQRLNYRVASRETLYDHVQETYGYTYQQAEELMDQIPTLGDLVLRRGQGSSIALDRRRLFYALQASLCELLNPDNAVYHGLAGHLLLTGVSHLLRVRMIAPRSMRIEMAMQMEGLTRVDAAHRIDRVDSERVRWTQGMFNVTWGDPNIFDVVLNLERVSQEEAAGIVADMTKLPSFAATPESIADLRNLFLRSRALATLLSTPETQDLALSDVEADTRTGNVKVLGHLSHDEAERVKKVVKKLEGVRQVEV